MPLAFRCSSLNIGNHVLHSRTATFRTIKAAADCHVTSHSLTFWKQPLCVWTFKAKHCQTTLCHVTEGSNQHVRCWQNWKMQSIKHSSLLKNKKPTRCHLLLFYCTSYRLNMFRALLSPSSAARGYNVDYHIGRFVLVCCKLEVTCG